MDVDGDYPEKAPNMEIEGKKGVKFDQVGKIKQALEDEAEVLLGMPMTFSLCEKAKQLLDDLSGGQVAEVEDSKQTEEKEEKALNHQVGNPLIMDGTRCTENVFLAWKEKWLEEREEERKKKEEKQLSEFENKPTGKEMFLRGIIKSSDESMAHKEIENLIKNNDNNKSSEDVPIDSSLFMEELK